ncbi:MAG: hypothetical protein IT184_16840 [Acidobacteria bacterium]|nr:hypothetical protein [Acidobacteriota bacterium]
MLARQSGSTSAAARADGRRLVSVLGLSFFAVVLLRTAWVSDAGLRAMRTAEQAASGHGLRWNVAERVQTFDHPLWVLVLTAARTMTGEMYLTTLSIGIVCSLGVLILLLRRAAEPVQLVAIGGVALSPTFVSYSTAGIGTPLLHLLALAIAVTGLRTAAGSRSAWTCAALVGAGGLAHWTLAVAMIPLLIAVSRARPARQRVLMGSLALTPLVVWWGWAWWYYGAPLPNGTIADLAAGVPWRQRIATGAEFLADTARIDPILVAVTILGAAVGLLTSGASTALAVGSLLLAAWAVLAGGSLEAGLGLTVPFIVGLCLLVRWLNARPAAIGASAFAAVAVSGTVLVPATFRSDSSYGAGRQVSAYAHDVRADMYPATGLLFYNRFRQFPGGEEAERGQRMAAAGPTTALSTLPGLFAAGAGLTMHVIDPAGMTDPLLARLPPAVSAVRTWGAVRRIPEGYVESVRDRPSALADPALAPAVEILQEATRGPLLDGRRFGMLMSLRSGVAASIAQSTYGLVRVRLDDVAAGASRPALEVREGGLLVQFSRRPVKTLVAILSARHNYTVDFLDGDRLVRQVESPRLSWEDLPPRARPVSLGLPQLLTALLVRCGRGVGRCTFSDAELRE